MTNNDAPLDPDASCLQQSELRDELTFEHNVLMDRGLSYLEDHLIVSPSTGTQIWEAHLYDEHVCTTGAGHGFAGVGLAILNALPLLPAVDQTDSPLPNWLVQFCHGAPGVIMCLADLMEVDEQFDALMLGGAAPTYEAGPLTKGGNMPTLDSF